jgi:hypothetical protein
MSSSKRDDVYGDGVNIATRLEGIARPGEVYISGGIYEQIKHKLVCGYESLGDRHVKNITDPVRVYRVLSDPAALQQNRKRRESLLASLLACACCSLRAALSGTCFGNRASGKSGFGSRFTSGWKCRRRRAAKHHRRRQPASSPLAPTHQSAAAAPPA